MAVLNAEQICRMLNAEQLCRMPDAGHGQKKIFYKFSKNRFVFL